MRNLLFILTLLILTGCVAFTKTDIPITTQESVFFNELKQGTYPKIDSISREILRQRYGDYLYQYDLDIYTAEEYLLEDSRDTLLLKEQATQIVSFLVNELSLVDVKIQTICISYRYGTSSGIGYIADIDKNGNFAFTLEP